MFAAFMVPGSCPRAPDGQELPTHGGPATRKSEQPPIKIVEDNSMSANRACFFILSSLQVLS